MCLNCATLLATTRRRAPASRWRDFARKLFYVHKMADLSIIQALLKSDARLVRMVHDHDIYCMRSYKYNYFTRASAMLQGAGIVCCPARHLWPAIVPADFR